MLYTINELKQKVFHSVYDVYDIFKNFFDEEHVDLQNMPHDGCLLPPNVSMEQLPSYDINDDLLRAIKRSVHDARPNIIVWWPEVTVSNENDRSIKIQDLYAKITITMEGTIPYENTGFQLNRTTFSSVQYISRYIHSHVPSRNTPVPVFQNPCLGSGPIKNTIMDLKNGYDEYLWMLFCQELSLYVTVESLRGIPYRKLEEVGYKLNYAEYNNFSSSIFSMQLGLFYSDCKEFVDYYLKNGHLKIMFANGEYQVGMSCYEYMLDVSNTFISWVNTYGNENQIETYNSADLLVSASVSQGIFYYNTENNNRQNYTEVIGRPVLMFKNEQKTLRIVETADDECQTVTLLNYRIAFFILYNILRTINYHYKNEYVDGNTSEGPSEVGERVCYLQAVGS